MCFLFVPWNPECFAAQWYNLQSTRWVDYTLSEKPIGWLVANTLSCGLKDLVLNHSWFRKELNPGMPV